MAVRPGWASPPMPMGKAATRRQAQAERLLTRSSNGGNSTVASTHMATLETSAPQANHRIVDESDIEFVGYIGRARYARVKRTHEELILTSTVGYNVLDSDKVSPSV